MSELIINLLAKLFHRNVFSCPLIWLVGRDKSNVFNDSIVLVEIQCIIPLGFLLLCGVATYKDE